MNDIWVDFCLVYSVVSQSIKCAAWFVNGLVL